MLASVSLITLLRKSANKYNHGLKLPNAVKRDTVRLLQFVQILETFYGEIMKLCFEYISFPTEAPAVKAFSLTILQNLAQAYPKIKEEVKIIIEDRWEIETPAIKSRAKRFLTSGKA